MTALGEYSNRDLKSVEPKHVRSGTAARAVGDAGYQRRCRRYGPWVPEPVQFGERRRTPAIDAHRADTAPRRGSRHESIPLLDGRDPENVLAKVALLGDPRPEECVIEHGPG